MPLHPITRRIVPALLLGSWLHAQDTPEHFGPKPSGGSKAKAQYEANLKAHKGNPDVLVLPGLVADRKARRIDVLVECTGLKANETVEFLLVGQDSSHGYEALLWSMARPGDVHRALEFIGLKPGPPANPSLPRFVPDGDRVTLGVRDDGSAPVPIEQLVLDTETGRTLPEEGFVFAGSMTVPPQDGKGPWVYAADVTDARSVASIFSDPAAVLDVPRRVDQSEAYGRQVVNPEAAFDGGKLLTVVISPAGPDGRPPARRLQLLVDCAAGATGTVCSLAETNGVRLAEASTLPPLLEKLATLRKPGDAPPCIALCFGGAAPLRDVGRACRVLAMMETMGLVRIVPPAADQIYHRAFTPDPAWLRPEERPSQPWELHLRRQDGKVAGEMAWQEALWSDDRPTPAYQRRAFAAATPGDVRARLDADRREREQSGRPALPAALLVYAPATLRYGDLLAFVRPALSTHGTVYVFVEEETGDTLARPE
jgi:hypothetical protein